MANAMYPSAKESFITGGIDVATATIKNDLIDTGTYVYSSAHNFYDDVVGSVDTSGALASKTTTNGTFDAADLTHSAVTGATVEALILWVDTVGASSTDDLIMYLDTSVTGLPLTPNGGDVVIQWNVSGIFAL